MQPEPFTGLALGACFGCEDANAHEHAISKIMGVIFIVRFLRYPDDSDALYANTMQRTQTYNRPPAHLRVACANYISGSSASRSTLQKFRSVTARCSWLTPPNWWHSLPPTRSHAPS